MKVESLEVADASLVEKIVNAVKPSEPDLRASVNANYPLTEIRVNLKEGKVFVVWEDYSEEEQRIKELTQEALAIKEQLKTTTDEVKKAVLVSKLGQIDEEYKRLTGVEIYEVI